MHWPSFALGIVATVAVLVSAARLFPFQAMKLYNATYMRWFDRKYHKKPLRIASIGHLHGFVKTLAEQDGEATLFVQSGAPVFTVRISRKNFRSRPDVLVLEVRNVDANRAGYAAARTALSDQGPTLTEVMTPRRQQPSRARITVDVGTFATSAIVSAARAVFESVGVPPTSELLVSDLDPGLWPRQPETRDTE